MIIEPDFIDHWKTRLLVDLTGSESAPLFVIRLWAHCQQRRQWKFTKDQMNQDILKAICRFPGEATVLWDAMTKTFLDFNAFDASTEVHGWAEVNAALVRNWRNGKITAERHGPPQEGANDRPRGGHGLGQAMAKGGAIREDKRREDKTEEESPSLSELIEYGKGAAAIPEDVCKSFHDWHTERNLWFNQYGKLVNWQRMLIKWKNNQRPKPAPEPLAIDLSKPMTKEMETKILLAAMQ